MVSTAHQQAYHQRYRKEYKSRRHAKDREKRERRRKQAIEFLGGKCLDCGIEDKRVLVFDHVRGEKTTNVAGLLDKSWKRIESELNKCELVCANCHLIRTNGRIPKAADEFVGRRERKTHCAQGHPWIEDNIYTSGRGTNSCLVCKRARARRTAKRKRGNLRRQRRRLAAKVTT